MEGNMHQARSSKEMQPVVVLFSTIFYWLFFIYFNFNFIMLVGKATLCYYQSIQELAFKIIFIMFCIDVSLTTIVKFNGGINKSTNP